jgi:hypothetical protein
MKLGLLIKSVKDSNLQVLIKFWQKKIQRRGKKYIVRPTNKLNLSQIKNNLPIYASDLILSICKKGYKTDCNDHRHIFLPLLHSFIKNSSLNANPLHVDEIGGYHQCGLHRAVEKTPT